MNAKNSRWSFVFTLTVLGTLYGAILAFRLLHYQADVLSDVLKMSAIICLGVFILSYVWWTLITPKLKGPRGGAVAGFLTALCIIPVPTFLGGFKSNFSTQPNVIDAALSALSYSFSTFSLAEFIALPLCAATGYILAK